jgi:hypothetical protein
MYCIMYHVPSIVFVCTADDYPFSATEHGSKSNLLPNLLLMVTLIPGVWSVVLLASSPLGPYLEIAAKLGYHLSLFWTNMFVGSIL